MRTRLIFLTALGGCLVGLVPAGAAADYATTVMSTTNLLGYWRFATSAPTNSEVNGYTGTYHGGAAVGPTNSGPALALGSTNAALFLNGTNGYVSTSLTGQIGSQGSIVGWFNLGALPSTDGHFYYLAGESQNGNDFDLQIETDNKLKLFTTSGGAVVAPTALTATDLNKWHFFAATFTSGSNRRLYLDGELVATSGAGNHNANAAAFNMGASDVFAGRYFRGRLDEIAVYGRELSSNEVAAIYAARVFGPTNTATALAASVNPADYGAAVTFTATVAATNNVPGGTVTFSDGVTNLGTGALDGGGQATFTTNRLSVSGSPHAIAAAYNGDGIFAGSTASALAQTIVPAALTVTGITANSRFYDGTFTATLNTNSAALNGVLSGDVVTLNSGSATGAFASRNVYVGQTVTVSGLALAGAAAGNYTLTPPTATASIYARSITVMAVADTKPYDGTAGSSATPTLTAGSLATGDAAAWTQSFANKNVGTGKTLYPAGAVSDGNDGNNYNVTFVTSAGGTITARGLTVSADNKLKMQGLLNPALTVQYSGFVGGDDASVFTTPVSVNTVATTASPPGPYPITASGGVAANYSLSYVAGTLTVVAPPQAAAVTVLADQFDFNCDTLTNYNYQLEYKSAMTDSNWTPLGTPFAGTGNSMAFTNTVGGPMGFYRLKITP